MKTGELSSVREEINDQQRQTGVAKLHSGHGKIEGTALRRVLAALT